MALQQTAELRRFFCRHAAADTTAGYCAGIGIFPCPTRSNPKPFAVALKQILTVAVFLKPIFNLHICHALVSLTLGEFLQIGVEIGQKKDDEGQTQRGEEHDPTTFEQKNSP